MYSFAESFHGASELLSFKIYTEEKSEGAKAFSCIIWELDKTFPIA